MGKLFRLLCFVCLMVPAFLIAQDKSPVIKDNQLWTSVGLKARLHKRIYASIETAFRGKDNWQTPNSFFYEAGLKWKKKDVSVSGNLRLIERYSRKETRWYVDGVYALKSSKRFDLDVRCRVQNAVYSDNNPNETFVRGKLKAKYNIRKNPINPVADFELFYHANAYIPSFEVMRWSAGFETNVIQDLEFSMLYRNELEFNVTAPNFSHIFIFGLNYDLGKLYKKKSK